MTHNKDKDMTVQTTKNKKTTKCGGEGPSPIRMWGEKSWKKYEMTLLTLKETSEGLIGTYTYLDLYIYIYYLNYLT